MRRYADWSMILTILLLGLGLASPRSDSARGSSPAQPQADLPRVQFHESPQIQITGVDSNSPAHWDGDTLYVFNSYGHPWRNSGQDISHLGNRISTKLGDLNDKLYIWIEATWKDED